MLVHQFCALGCIADPRTKCGIVHPVLAALIIEIEIGIEEGMKGALNGWVVAGGLFILTESFHPPVAGYSGPPRKYGFEQVLLVLEIVVDKGGVDTDTFGDVSQGNPVQTIPGEQVFRCI